MRGDKVLLDVDLAELYGVTTGALNQAVRRNRRRFPEDFLLQLSEQEWEGLRSQIVIAKRGSGGRRSRPWAFTEHGAIMAASILKSRRAVEMSVFVVRAFIRLREFARSHGDLASKLDRLERRVTDHDGASRTSCAPFACWWIRPFSRNEGSASSRRIEGEPSD